MANAELIGMDAAADALAKQIGAALPDVLAAFAAEALKEIKPRWPVRTGKSRDALKVSVEGSQVFIVCDVPYASRIHLKGEIGPTYHTRIIEYIQQNYDRIGKNVTAKLKAA